MKISKFGTFTIRKKVSRVGRNPKTKEKKIISERNVVLFKPSKELKKTVESLKSKNGEIIIELEKIAKEKDNFLTMQQVGRMFLQQGDISMEEYKRILIIDQ